MMVRAAALFVLLATLAACAPRLSPPYRDYEVRATEADVTDRLREAAEAAGWTVAESLDPAVVTTAPRDVGAGLTSSTSAALDLVPLDGGFVRVYVRAERRSVLGGRSKVYALDGAMRQRILGPLSEALAERGLVPLGTPRDRDEDATE
ncbi:hypothetical protein [Rubrivirga sp. IMCC45206]|uniref:hypothetical protein n=1 Tax=Rubrivirga sp. IMCC45206 TaxID=3391614 RepID=UPI0039903421